MKIVRALLLALLLPFTALAQDRISSYERMKNFGIVYGAQWTVYLVLQRQTIEDHGSLDNWIHYPTSPHFDNDSFDYNLFQHSLVGASYFLFYRSQGYQKVDAFLWSILSSTAFEFTIETVTERPSWQDLYQTPVYGTLLGLGLETVSDSLWDTGKWWGKALGVLTNPFRLLKKDDEHKEAFLPLYAPGSYGVTWTREFE